MSKTAIIGNAIAQGIADYINQRYKDSRERREYRIKRERERNEKFENAEWDKELAERDSLYGSERRSRIAQNDTKALDAKNKMDAIQHEIDMRDTLNDLYDKELELKGLQNEFNTKFAGWQNKNFNDYSGLEKSRLKAGVSDNNTRMNTNALRVKQNKMEEELIPYEKLAKTQSLINQQEEGKLMNGLLESIYQLKGQNTQNDLAKSQVMGEILRDPNNAELIKASILGIGNNEKDESNGKSSANYKSVIDAINAMKGIVDVTGVTDINGNKTMNPNLGIEDSVKDALDALGQIIKPNDNMSVESMKNRIDPQRIALNNAVANTADLINNLPPQLAALFPQLAQAQAIAQTANQTPAQLTTSGIQETQNKFDKINAEFKNKYR